jgi:hypothetical protein
MPHYKDLNNNLHFLESSEFENLLPSGCTQIPEEEVSSFSPSPSYKDLRATEYPDFREYLDGIVKGDQVQINTYIAACLAVKDKYPKE